MIRLYSAVLVLSVLALWSIPAQSGGSKNIEWTITDVLSGGTPFAIGHRGYGANLGEVDDIPLENRVKAVRKAYRDGIRIVEVDVVLSGDGKIVVNHDDFLPDFPCLNSLNYGQIRARLPQAPLLRHVLKAAYVQAHNADSASGQVIIELKSASPLCDPFDQTGPQLVQGVIDDIYRTGMQDQVLIDSFAPDLILEAAIRAPSIGRTLGVSVLQFMTPEQVEAATGLPVTLINKDAGLGLQWAETGPFFRLPGYASFEQYVGIVLAVGSTCSVLDIRLLGQAEQSSPGAGAAMVDTLQGFGVCALGFTAVNAPEWGFLQFLGVDGIFTDDIPLGVAIQGN